MARFNIHAKGNDMNRFRRWLRGGEPSTSELLNNLICHINELVDVNYKIANELAQMNLILDNKKDISDYDPIWKSIPGMEQA